MRSVLKIHCNILCPLTHRQTATYRSDDMSHTEVCHRSARGYWWARHTCEPDGNFMGHNGTIVIMFRTIIMMMLLVSSCCPSASYRIHSARSQWHCHSKVDRYHLHQSISHVQFARTRKRHAPTAIRLYVCNDAQASRFLVPLFWRQTTLERMAANLRFKKRRLDIL